MHVIYSGLDIKLHIGIILQAPELSWFFKPPFIYIIVSIVYQVLFIC